MLFIADQALLFLDLSSNVGPRLGNLATARLVGLLLRDLLIEPDAALALEVQALNILQLLLLARIVLLRL